MTNNKQNINLLFSVFLSVDGLPLVCRSKKRKALYLIVLYSRTTYALKIKAKIICRLRVLV